MQNNLPRIIEVDDQQYEARTHHKEENIPYFPDFDLSVGQSMSPDTTRFFYRTMVRLEKDGVYYDVECADQYEINTHNLDVNVNIQTEILRQLVTRLTRNIYSAQLFYLVDNHPPSDYQFNEKLRVAILYHAYNMDMIKRLIDETN